VSSIWVTELLFLVILAHNTEEAQLGTVSDRKVRDPDHKDLGITASLTRTYTMYLRFPFQILPL